MQGSYNRRQLAEALRAVGVRRGDVVFSHSNIGYFGLPEEGRTSQAVFDTILGAFQDVLGPEGMLVVPTFTYSFCKRQPFDPAHTPSTCGALTEMLRLLPLARRSRDPIFSVAAVGDRADELTRDVPLECFGRGSFWDRFLAVDGIVCNLNCDAGSTFIHYVERQLNVPYRYDKLFTGQIIENGQAHKTAAIFFCQDLSNADSVAVFEPFDALVRARGLARTAGVGRGAVVALRAQAAFALLREELSRNPWLLTAAGKAGRTPVLRQPAPPPVVLRPDAPANEVLETLWRLPRDIVSDGYDAAIQALAQQLPMTIHEYPTGTHCWSWLVPEKWTCREAYLETLNGGRLFSYADNPLHVMSYSLPFEGDVTREELFAHLHTHPKLPGAVPFKFKYYERDWGLCCSQRLKDSLVDERYRVVIRSQFSCSTLKVGEIVAPGRSDETFILCAHLDHPAMVNDDLAGVVVGMEVMRELLKRTDLRYTYRFLILPETIGSVAWLSHHEDLIPKMKGGLFLEMLATPHPHALQMSYRGDTEIDRCLTRTLKRCDPHGWTGAFRTVIGNDERQFNAPGVRVPMLSLSRVLPPSHPEWPFREYHSSDDTPANARIESLAESHDLVLAMIDELEQNRVLVNRTKGEVFCSRYGIHIDFYTNPEGNRALFNIMYLIDGTRSVADIADELRISPAAVEGVVNELMKHELVAYAQP
jgi:aminopeptidase-like protein/aminoglycoside N3'-acetyltransferase